jgi:hypothetical protein
MYADDAIGMVLLSADHELIAAVVNPSSRVCLADPCARVV